jgi:ABC-type cobalamin transport system ATPase subunit
MHADRIYVLERGQVIECGKHDELLADKGLYYAMWRQQIGERVNVSMNGNGELHGNGELKKTKMTAYKP